MKTLLKRNGGKAKKNFRRLSETSSIVNAGAEPYIRYDNTKKSEVNSFVNFKIINTSEKYNNSVNLKKLYKIYFLVKIWLRKLSKTTK